MTAAPGRAILGGMKAVVATVLAVLLAVPARAEEPRFDLGFARPGMSEEEFRAAAWPPGVTVVCSHEKDRPEELERNGFALPKGLARIGASRCGLFTEEGGNWRPHRLTLAGGPAEVWGLFIPEGGTQRLVQICLTQWAGAFDTLADSWSERFGPPTDRRPKLARWSNARNDAVIIQDGTGNLQAYVIDNRLQAVMHGRVRQLPRR